MHRTFHATLLFLFGIAASAGSNMIGRQSQNEGITAMPAPGAVTIDGKLDDWDFSGRIWCFAEKSIRNRYSAQVGAMWDKNHLYVGIRWYDPTPMHNMIDPKFNPNFGWKGDSTQLRINTGTEVFWLTAWYFSERKVPVLHVSRWKSMKNMRKGQDVTLLQAKPGEVDLGQNAQMGFALTDDESGYVQEMRIPWALLKQPADKVKPGMMLRMGMEFLWGDPTGKTWPIHRYADNMEPGVTSREFFWSNIEGWGRLVLAPKGKVEERKYISAADKIQGTIPVRTEIPADAARFTLAIDDQNGKRIRTLAADADPADYTVARNGKTVTVEVMWDGLMDTRRYGHGRQAVYEARMAPAGSYRVRGLYHKGLGAEYEMSFYNPGTPAWNTADTTGAWGADHSNPYRVARAGDRMIICWPGAEGGHGIIAVGKSGRKVWGASRAAVHLAANEKYVFGLQSSHRRGPETLVRLAAKNGAYLPFALDGKERPFDLPVADILGVEKPGLVSALAATNATIALATTNGKLALLNPETAKPTVVLDVAGVTALAFSNDGKLYAVADKKVQQVNLKDGSLTAIKTDDVVNAFAIAVDADGNILVADRGPDSQVKAFSVAGKLVYTCGKKGGRPIRGAFDEQGMRNISSVAVDPAGKIWAVENWHAPRRVSVWGRPLSTGSGQAGKLVRDYVGNTGYAGTACFLHRQDPSVGYIGPIEVKLNRKDRSWKVSQVLWEPDYARGEGFQISVRSHAKPERFRSKASGKMREYLFTNYRYTAYVVYMKRATGWMPVSAVGRWGELLKTAAQGEARATLRQACADIRSNDNVFWNDANKDGKVQRDECEVLKAKEIVTTQRGKEVKTYQFHFRVRGGDIDPETMSFYNNGIIRFVPVGYDDEGAPRYGIEGMSTFPADDKGDQLPVPEDNVLLCLSSVGYAGPTKLVGYDLKTGAEKWYYPNPYPGVHGSHRATMPKPGLLIGPLGIKGVVNANDDAGNVFLMRGNLGQNFILTTDGLYVGAMMQDGRLPYQSLPPKEEQVVGMPMESFSEGGEPFNGWFGRQEDGIVRLTTGMARQAGIILRINGLENVHRLKDFSVTVSKEQLAKAAEENVKRAAAAAGPARYRIARMKRPPKIDGIANDWRGITPVTIRRSGSPEKTDYHLGYDAVNLYVMATVTDPSPWKNTGRDVTQLFKTGDGIDLQLCTDPGLTEKEKRKTSAADVRVFIAPHDGKPTAVLMKPVDPQTDKSKKIRYHSPIRDLVFDRVEPLDGVQCEVKAAGNSYTLEAAIPFAAIGLTPKENMTVRGDIGFISSDPDGKMNTARTYWSNKNTNLVNDLPSEAMLFTEAWGYLTFE